MKPSEKYLQHILTRIVVNPQVCYFLEYNFQNKLAKSVCLHSCTWPRGYKTFFILNSTEHEISTAQKTKIPTNEEVSCFKSLRCCIYHANKCFNINEQDKFCVQLS